MKPSLATSLRAYRRTPRAAGNAADGSASPAAARRRWIVLAGLTMLAACAGGGGSQPLSVTDRDTAAACRQQANNTYAIQNRDQIYRIQDPFSPQSGTGLTDLPTRGLSDQFAQERMVQDCIRNTGTETSRTQGSSGTSAAPAASGSGSAPSGALPASGSLSR